MISHCAGRQALNIFLKMGVSQGRLREDDREKAARLSLDMIKPMQSEQDSNHVIDARHTPLFSRKFLCSLADLALPLVCS
jgi:hypothetical protein